MDRNNSSDAPRKSNQSSSGRKSKGQLVAEFWAARRYRVRLKIPELGFGEATDDIVNFCEQRGESIGSAPSTDPGQRWKTRCFAFLSERNAKDFMNLFGGEFSIEGAGYDKPASDQK